MQEHSASVDSVTRVEIRTEPDIVIARQSGRAVASEVGFAGTDLTIIATAISEVGRNILIYAHHGELLLAPVKSGSKRGILVVAKDEGPGIENLELAMQDGYSTGRGLGLGLPGSRRLMDDFHIESEVGKGTTITMRKWLR